MILLLFAAAAAPPFSEGVFVFVSSYSAEEFAATEAATDAATLFAFFPPLPFPTELVVSSVFFFGFFDYAAVGVDVFPADVAAAFAEPDVVAAFVVAFEVDVVAAVAAVDAEAATYAFGA